MAPRETKNNAYAKFWGDKQRVLWYVMVFSGVVNCSTGAYYRRLKAQSVINTTTYLNLIADFKTEEDLKVLSHWFTCKMF